MLLGEAADAGREVELLEVGISRGITRQTSEIAPRWRNAFTRKRVPPAS